MRFLTLVLAILLLCGVVAAQQKYLVTPNQEVMPLDKRGETAAKAIAQRLAAERAANLPTCTNKYLFGFPMDLYPPNSNFGAYHKDVLGQWYTAKASGTIDTVFWYAYNAVGALDSIVKIRIHNSVIGPDYGPGVRDYAHGVNFPPPCQNWGYWVNTDDDDQRVAAFPEEATDTTWHSTINNAPQPSRPPFSNEIWGLGGQDAYMHSQKVCFYAMMTIDIPCNVTVGQKFFISEKVNAAGHVPNDTRTEWYASGFRVTNSDENYPSRNWKFYEHDSGPSNCAGVPVTLVKRGWVARGGFGADSLDVAVYNWWYVMTATTNVPPTIVDMPNGTGIPHNTASTSAQHVTVEVGDCDPTAPGNTGVVAGAFIEASVSPTTAAGSTFTRLPDVALVPTVGDQYEGDIPGQIPGTTISWRVRAVDNKGLIAYSPSHIYKIVSLRNQTYYVDTNYTPVWQNISGTGTQIDTSKFFIDTRISGHGTSPKDDGTAGPVDLGGPITYFGKPLQYAWIGVNGALSLSATASDTIDVNSNGFWTSNWDLPYLQRGGRADTNYPGRLPHAFISPMWSDFIIGDTVAQYGHIVHGPGLNATCEYVVEWDSIGDFDQTNGAFQDLTTFRVILNKCDNSIEFQWSSIGTRNKDSVALVGMEGYADSLEMVGSNPPFVFVCNQTYPAILRPANEKAMKFIPIGSLTTQAGWNMLSVATIPNDYRKAACYPEAVSDAFAYVAKYIPQGSTPLTNGPGYWLKYSTPTNGMVFGKPKNSVDVTVRQGWNMMGSITTPLPTASIVPDANTVINSRYFGYGAGYVSATTITPGKGYWVKINLLNSATTGTLTLTAPASLPKSSQPDELAGLNSITIRDKQGRAQQLYFGAESAKFSAEQYEMPPQAPEFDARFASGRQVETYPASIGEKARYDFPIQVATDAYPVTISWNVAQPVSGHSFVLTNGKQTLGVLSGAGSVTLKSAAERLSLSLGTGVNVPKVFALGQNYPNPFNPTTHFSVDVPKLTDVSVLVYDILGQRVATLMNGQVAANSYTLSWNATDDHGVTVPSGVYFIRMIAGDFSAVQKVMLMK